jgi:hypothetical protein
MLAGFSALFGRSYKPDGRKPAGCNSVGCASAGCELVGRKPAGCETDECNPDGCELIGRKPDGCAELCAPASAPVSYFGIAPFVHLLLTVIFLLRHKDSRVKVKADLMHLLHHLETAMRFFTRMECYATFIGLLDSLIFADMTASPRDLFELFNVIRNNREFSELYLTEEAKKFLDSKPADYCVALKQLLVDNGIT